MSSHMWRLTDGRADDASAVVVAGRRACLNGTIWPSTVAAGQKPRPAVRASAFQPATTSQGTLVGARFLYLLVTQTWDCFQGEGLLHVSPVFRSPCACLSSRPAPGLQWSSATAVAFVYAGGLLLLVLGLCAWCCYCGVPARPREPAPRHAVPRRDLLSRLGFGPTEHGEFHTANRRSSTRGEFISPVKMATSRQEGWQRLNFSSCPAGRATPRSLPCACTDTHTRGGSTGTSSL